MPKMPKVAESKLFKLKKYVRDYSPNFTTDGALLFCIPCQKTVSADRKFQVDQHLDTASHKRNAIRERKDPPLAIEIMNNTPRKMVEQFQFNDDFCIVLEDTEFQVDEHFETARQTRSAVRDLHDTPFGSEIIEAASSKTLEHFQSNKHFYSMSSDIPLIDNGSVSIFLQRSDICYQTSDISHFYDGIVFISTEDDPLTNANVDYAAYIRDLKDYDHKALEDVSFILLPEEFPIRRLVYSPVGPINRDYDDVRRFRDAAFKGVKRALVAGASRLLIRLPAISHILPSKRYELAELVTILGTLEPLYTPLEVREADGALGVRDLGIDSHENKLAGAIECGRVLARDIGGSDPERMTPAKVAEYVTNAFAHSSINVEVIDDIERIRKDFPCLAAVDRGSSRRHRTRVILLTYEPSNSDLIESTVCLIGKGVTYDTGGHDIKTNGKMKGMHRDKCGAAAVAGFMETVNKLKPSNIRVLGAMAMVRNSIGPESYVSDEIVTARSGTRIRICNTDAEGRMAMVDLLCYMKEKVLKKKFRNPQIFTIATLTGHARIAVGYNYSVIMSNGPAEEKNIPQLVATAGMRIGDPFEISTIRREDYEANLPETVYEDINQCHLLPSAQVPRGHQIPAAFLITASGLDKHGLQSEQQICYSHVDIAKTSPLFDGVPSGSPIAALTVALVAKDVHAV